MTLTGKVIPTLTWPSSFPRFVNGDPWNSTTELEARQPVVDALAALQLSALGGCDVVTAHGSETKGALLPVNGYLQLLEGAGGVSSDPQRPEIGGTWTVGTGTASTGPMVTAVGHPTAVLKAHDATSDMIYLGNFDTYAFNEITTVHGALWSPYSSLYVAVGLDSGASNRERIETSPGSSGWTLRTTVANNSRTKLCIAQDPTGRYILVGSQGTGNDIVYVSTDGGLTFSVASYVNYRSMAHLCYAPNQDLWLAADGAVLRSNTLTGPWSGSAWAIRYTFPADRVTTISGLVALPGGLLVATTDHSSYHIQWVSGDGGLTWVPIGQLPHSVLLQYVGGYVLFSGTNSYVSRRLG